MKRVLFFFLALSLFASGFVFAAAPARGRYQIDPVHSRVAFTIPHLVISTVEGQFNTYKGTITIGSAGLSSLATELVIDVNSIDTENEDRDKHLRSPDFFDEIRHPKMTFTSTKVSGTEKDLSIQGNLTIRGIKKPVILRGKYLGTVKDPQGNTRIAFQASSKIKRADFGLNWNKLVEAGPVVGDEATIKLQIQAIQEKPKLEAKGSARNTS